MSTIKLYYATDDYEWELLPSKLLIVEDIENYLKTKGSRTIPNFQYIKNDLELSINIDMTQDYSQPNASFSFKYVAILNSGENERIYYYFVKKSVWRSKSTIRLELVMDVLNTFQEGRDYDFKANTRIIREHKDRLSAYKSNRYSFTLDVEYISYEPEEDDTIKIIKYDDNTLICTAKVIFAETQDAHHWDFYIDVISGTFNDTFNNVEVYIKNEDESDNSYGRLKAIKNIASAYYRKIDYISEGINPVLQCGSASGEAIEDQSVLDQDWYILYRNQNDPTDSLVNPVECYIIPENETKTNSAYIVNGRLIPSFIEEGKYYYFKTTDGLATLSNGITLTTGGTPGRQLILITKAGGVLSVSYFYCGSAYGDNGLIKANYDGITYITFASLPVPYRKENSFIAPTYSTQDNMPDSFNNSGTENTLDPITELDRTDAKNIKLIKLPYCPYDFNVSGTTLQTNGDSNWEYVSLSQAGGGIINVLKLKNMHLKLTNNLSHTSNNPLSSLAVNNDSPSITPNIYSLRGTEALESKLFHSDFYQPTYYYDSFSYKVQLEKLNINSYIPLNNINSLIIIFDMTSTINSRFMFTFDNLSFRYATENYAKYMPLARNNEEVLYNVPYINYIRTGFNYDVKAKERALGSNIAGIALSGASTIAALAFPSAPLKIAGVVAGLVSMAMSIKNTVVNTIQNEESIQKKIQETQNQSVSVAGSDDVDLMSIYAENRLKYLVYQPSPIMKQALFDLFFYAGYNSGRLGIPTHNNRVNFDYLEADVQLQSLTSMPDDCLQELINCFKTGVVYMHKTTRTSDKWDFEQKYENWENNLLED